MAIMFFFHRRTCKWEYTPEALIPKANSPAQLVDNRVEWEERATATFGKGKKAQPAIAEKGGKDSKQGKEVKFRFGWLEMASIAPEPPRLEVDKEDIVLRADFFKEHLLCQFGSDTTRF